MAKQRRFKCSKCDRKFSMAAHLARHMNTMHASKKVTATKRKRASVAIRGGPEVGSVLGSLKAYREQLADQRNQIANRMQAIDAALAALGAGAAKSVVARRKRGKGVRAGTLKDYIARVLRGLVKGKSVKDIAVAVKKAGYKSKNKRMNHAVTKALADMKNVLRIGRGVYRLR